MDLGERLQKIDVLNFSEGIQITKIHGKIKPLRDGYYKILNIPLTGDAPKDFICMYNYGDSKRNKPKTWDKYIAKVGHKWYPQESIIEHLFNRIGETLGLEIAESKLRMAHGQLRFLSKYFLEDNETLMHGAQIYSAYLEEINEEFVQEIETNELSRTLLTFQFTHDAIKYVFPAQHIAIMESFIKLLMLDAIVGNNDRHFYNWAVITDIGNEKEPRFSPIYDTARGLFWNKSERIIDEKFYEGKGKKRKISQMALNKYTNDSRPKTGWDGWKGKKSENHFKLIESIYNTYPKYQSICKSLLNDVHLANIETLIRTEFKPFFTKQRYNLIQECIKKRFDILKDLCN